MKRIIAAAFVLVLAGTATAHAGVNFSVNVGVPAPVVVGGYGPAPAPVVVQQDPRFIYSPDLGYYVSVGTPYQMVFYDNCYYRYRGGSWYLANTYGGPWSPVPLYRVPGALRAHSYREIGYYRDREFRHYDRDREHYRGTWFRPVGSGREERREWHGEGQRGHGDRDGNRGHGDWDRR